MLGSNQKYTPGTALMTLADPAPKKEPMSHMKLASILEANLQGAIGVDNTSLSQDRMKAEDYYFGKPFGTERQGRSQVVITVVADVIDATMTELMNMFCSGDEWGRFDPTGEEDEEEARQRTDNANYVFMKENGGFMILHDFFWDALVKRNGIVKVWWQEETQKKIDNYRGISDDMLATLLFEDEVELLERETVIEEQEVMAPAQDPNTGQPIQVPQKIQIRTHNVKVARINKAGRVCVENVPPEEFYMARRSKSIKNNNFVAHKRKVTDAELANMGYAPELIDKLPESEDSLYEENEKMNRFIEEDGGSPLTDNIGLRTYDYVEAYMNLDYDGDGIAERIKVCAVGDEILDIDQGESVIFCSISPYPIPHKWSGQSQADRTMDMQLIQSTLIRNVLDYFYLLTNPRHLALKGRVNYDDLLTPRPNGIVRVDERGAVEPLPLDPMPPMTFNMIEYLETIVEKRTGVTRYNQGLDADSLNKTKGGLAMILSKSQLKMLMIGRIFAETGVKDIFNAINALTARYVDKKKTVRLRGKYVEVDPRSWNKDMDATVEVGLGTGTRETKLMALEGVYAKQREIVAVQGGAEGPLVTQQNVFNTLDQLIQNNDLKITSKYFSDPKTYKAPPPQPPQPTVAEQLMDKDITLKHKRDTIKQASDIKFEQRKLDQRDVELKNDTRRIAIEEAQAANKIGVDRAQFIKDANHSAVELAADIGQRDAEMTAANGNSPTAPAPEPEPPTEPENPEPPQ